MPNTIEDVVKMGAELLIASVFIFIVVNTVFWGEDIGRNATMALSNISSEVNTATLDDLAYEGVLKLSSAGAYALLQQYSNSFSFAYAGGEPMLPPFSSFNGLLDDLTGYQWVLVCSETLSPSDADAVVTYGSSLGITSADAAVGGYHFYAFPTVINGREVSADEAWQAVYGSAARF